jgi:hypothetical protein
MHSKYESGKNNKSYDVSDKKIYDTEIIITKETT